MIGMRLHSIILSVLTVKPFMARSNLDKVKNILETAGLKNEENFDDLIKNRTSNIHKINLARASFRAKSVINKNALTKSV